MLPYSKHLWWTDGSFYKHYSAYTSDGNTVPTSNNGDHLWASRYIVGWRLLRTFNQKKFFIASVWLKTRTISCFMWIFFHSWVDFLENCITGSRWRSVTLTEQYLSFNLNFSFCIQPNSTTGTSHISSNFQTPLESWRLRYLEQYIWCMMLNALNRNIHNSEVHHSSEYYYPPRDVVPQGWCSSECAFDAKLARKFSKTNLKFYFGTKVYGNFIVGHKIFSSPAAFTRRWDARQRFVENCSICLR